MKYLSIIILSFSFLLAEDTYCNTSNLDFHTTLFSREYYNIGDTLSGEDQLYPYTICHSDGYYDVGTTFTFGDYSGDIILISMNATW